MIYKVEDTDTGFKLTVISSSQNRVLSEREVPGSHSPIAEAYGILERSIHGHYKDPVTETKQPRLPITQKVHRSGVDFSAGPPTRYIRVGVEDGKLWVNDLHHGTLEEAEALAQCILLAMEWQRDPNNHPTASE